MWSFRARDDVATAIHGMWGSFWMAYGVLYSLFMLHALPQPPGAFPELRFWFLVLGAITWMGFFAVLAKNLGMAAVLLPLAAGSSIAAWGFWAGSTRVESVAGWVFVISAAAAWYVASAMMLESSTGRVILPTLKTRSEANVPGEQVTFPTEFEWAEPGVKKGQ
jgi:uncharacterized protein